MNNSCKTELESCIAASEEGKAKREAGKAELEAMTEMVVAWRDSYIKWECETAAKDFMEEIDQIVYPYLKRLFECGFIDENQFREFLNFCDEQMSEISKSGREVS
ncbi:MAG: hypothetical protein ACYC0Q_06145 [Eubacteriales bacterium]